MPGEEERGQQKARKKTQKVDRSYKGHIHHPVLQKLHLTNSGNRWQWKEYLAPQISKFSRAAILVGPFTSSRQQLQQRLTWKVRGKKWLK